MLDNMLLTVQLVLGDKTPVREVGGGGCIAAVLFSIEIYSLGHYYFPPFMLHW